MTLCNEDLLLWVPPVPLAPPRVSSPSHSGPTMGGDPRRNAPGRCWAALMPSNRDRITAPISVGIPRSEHSAQAGTLDMQEAEGSSPRAADNASIRAQIAPIGGGFPRKRVAQRLLTV